MDKIIQKIWMILSRKYGRYLFKQHRSEFRQVNPPVSPDVATVGFAIGIFKTHSIQCFSVIGVCLVQKIGVADSNPVEFKTVVHLFFQGAVNVFVNRAAYVLIG